MSYLDYRKESLIKINNCIWSVTHTRDAGGAAIYQS